MEASDTSAANRASAEARARAAEEHDERVSSQHSASQERKKTQDSQEKARASQEKTRRADNERKKERRAGMGSKEREALLAADRERKKNRRAGMGSKEREAWLAAHRVREKNRRAGMDDEHREASQAADRERKAGAPNQDHQFDVSSALDLFSRNSSNQSLDSESDDDSDSDFDKELESDEELDGDCEFDEELESDAERDPDWVWPLGVDNNIKVVISHAKAETKKVRKNRKRIRDKLFDILQRPVHGCASCGRTCAGAEDDDWFNVDLSNPNILRAVREDNCPDRAAERCELRDETALRYVTRTHCQVSDHETAWLLLYPKYCYVGNPAAEGEKKEEVSEAGRLPTHATFCKSCRDGVGSVKRPKKPKYSLARGFDPGNLCELPKLTSQEAIVLARVRCFKSTLKISPGKSKHGFQGHIICFDQDMLLNLLERLKTAEMKGKPCTLDDNLKITFVGTQERWEKSKRSLCSKLQEILKIRAEVIKEWARILVMLDGSLEGVYSDYLCKFYRR